MRRFLLGSTAVRAPEDDRGAAFDDVDTDLDLDDIDPDGALDDEGLDDDQGGDDDADQGGGDNDDQGGDDDAGGRQPSRRERDVGGLRARAREAEARAAASEARLSEFLAGQQRQQTQASQQQERELLETMTEGERLSYMLKKQAEGFNSEIAKLRFEQQDAADQVKFDALCTRNPTADKLKGEVEKKLGELRKSGQTAPRETILKFVLGERALERAAKGQGTKQRNRAEARVARQTTRPAAPRSDATPDDRRTQNEAEARRKRLENMTF